MPDVPLTEEAVGIYLDAAIRAWRKRVGADSPDVRLMATHYVDAFQSVRVSLLGEPLAVVDA